MIEVLKIIFVASIGLAFACCEVTSFWWILPLTCVLLMLQWPLSLSLVAALILMSPIFIRRQHEKNRVRQLIRDLPDFVERLSNCLRAGLTLEASIKECREHCRGVTQEIANNLSHRITLGTPLEEALEEEAQNYPQVHLLHQLNSAVQLSRQSGMDVSTLFDTLASDARDDVMNQERMMSLSAQGRLQAWVIGLFPFALFALFALMEPERIQSFINDSRGQFMIGCMILLEIVGVIWIKRLIRI